VVKEGWDLRVLLWVRPSLLHRHGQPGAWAVRRLVSLQPQTLILSINSLDSTWLFSKEGNSLSSNSEVRKVPGRVCISTCSPWLSTVADGRRGGLVSVPLGRPFCLGFPAIKWLVPGGPLLQPSVSTSIWPCHSPVVLI
jgi:hypothetical protein